MATTKIHSIKKTLDKSIDYIINPAKTNNGLLVSAYGCPDDAKGAAARIEEAVPGFGGHPYHPDPFPFGRNRRIDLRMLRMRYPDVEIPAELLPAGIIREYLSSEYGKFALKCKLSVNVFENLHICMQKISRLGVFIEGLLNLSKKQGGLS